jgi:hypothetical protein
MTTVKRKGIVKFKADDYVNNITALGTPGKDKSPHTSFALTADLQAEELDGMYEKESLAGRIIDRVVDDATRVDFSLTGTDEKFDWASVKSELDDLDALNQFADAWRWARLYGGSIVIMNIDDNVDIAKPLQLDRATEIRSLEIVESRFATPDFFSRGLGSRAFLKPSAYDIVTPLGHAGKVHGTRVIRFDGVRVPPTRLLNRAGWGPSVLDKIWRDLRRLGSAMGYAEAILHEISVMMLSIKGYREQMAGSAEGKRTIQQIFEKMRWGIDNLNTLVLDSEDVYEEKTRTVTGMDALLTHFVDAMVRATDMPRTVLLGEQPGGLNASADSEVRAWYDHVANQQQKVLTPALNVLLEHIFALRAKRSEPVPDEWTIEYEPLWQPTEQEKAATALVRAQTAQIQQTILSVASPEEIREQMIADGDITPIEDELPRLPLTGSEFGT